MVNMMHTEKPEKRTWWATGLSAALFLLGATSVVLHFSLGMTTGWGPAILIIFGPFILGTLGLFFGLLAKQWVLAVLNGMLMLTFPAIMFFGTLLFGP